ncbi:RNA polymerase sigma factor [Streptomyces sp. NPDC048523]|uniref:RNA polymerase sigma factor n=1 Tax=Streptomyces sp. NPDC048523 TaxID=3365567 RepID=UPI00371B5D4D
MAEEERSAAHAEAVADLVAERYEQLVGYARKRLRALGVPLSSADPEDVVQIALTNVLTHREPIEKLRPYVFTVVKNETRHAASRHHTGQGYGSLDRDLRLEDAGLTVDPCPAVDLRLGLQDAMSALPPQQRRALLYRMQGYTQAETAAAMGTAPGTVATHMSRAVGTLRMTLSALAMALTGSGVAWLYVGVRAVTPAAGGSLRQQLTAYAATMLITLLTVLFLAAGAWLVWEIRKVLPNRTRGRVRPGRSYQGSSSYGSSSDFGSSSIFSTSDIPGG